jgi:hypothetical protein
MVFLWGTLALIQRLLCIALNSTIGYIMHAERKGSIRHGVPNVSGRGSLLFIIHNCMSQRRQWRCLVGDVLCHCFEFYITNDCFHSSFSVIYVWRNKGAFGWRYVHNLPETVLHDLLCSNYMVQWPCMTSSNPDIYLKNLTVMMLCLHGWLWSVRFI